MRIKASQIYDWDAEPVDERPSEFSSTSAPQQSGFYELSRARQRPRATTSAFGFKGLLVFTLAVLGVGIFVMYELANVLRG